MLCIPKSTIIFSGLLTLAVIFSPTSVIAAADGWQLKKAEAGIRIFTRAMANSSLKAVRAEFTIKTTMQELVDYLMDVEKQKEWVYTTKYSRVIKKTGNAEVYYYSEKDMPGPVSNRDAVLHQKIAINAATGVMTLEGSAIKDMVPVKKDIVRVPYAKVTWQVTPADNMLLVVYEAEVDPGGSLPSWVVNMFIAKGPYETFRKLKQNLEKP
jgi:hypothetical protein